MQSTILSDTAYTFRELRNAADRPGEVFACFTVEDVASGRVHEELLSMTVLEARVMLWEDALQQDPSQQWLNLVGAENNKQYLLALVGVLKRQI